MSEARLASDQHFDGLTAEARRALQTERLGEACGRLSRAIGVKAIQRVLVESAIAVTDSDNGGCGLVVKDRLVFDEGLKDGAWMSVSLSFGSGDDIPGHVFATGEPYVCNDTQYDERVNPNLRDLFGFYNLVDAPMLDAAGNLIGCIEVHNSHGRRPYDEQDVEVLLDLGRAAAIAILAARSVETEQINRSEISRQRDLLKAAIESTQDGILVVSSSGKITVYNSHFRDMWQLPDDLLAKGDDVALIDHCKRQLTDPAAFKARVDAIYSGDEDTTETLTLIDGRVFTRHTMPLYVGGKQSGRVWNFSDITVQHQQQDALLSQQNMSQLILSSISEGLYKLGMDGRIAFVNPAASEMLGYEEEEMVGKDAHALFHHSTANGEPLPRDDCTIYRALESGDEVRVSNELFWRAAGTSFPVEYLCAPIMEKGATIGAVVTFFDISDRIQSLQRVQFLAYHDSLTGLPNRSLLSDRIDHALARCRRRAQTGALLFFDLDHFKTINDSLGHSVGDQLLAQIAERLRESVRAEDTVARLGGDEFVVLIDDRDSDETVVRERAAIVATKLKKALTKPYRCGEFELHTSASIGIALFSWRDSSTDDVLRRADSAMYSAKEHGRDTIEFFAPEMAHAAEERLDLQNELRRALNTESLHLQFQPKVDIASGRIVGAEALLRWAALQDTVPVFRVIQVAEECGLILPLGRWVIEQTCRALSEWAKVGITNINVALNLSATQFHQAGLPDLIGKSLKEYGISATQLEVEITETTLMENSEAVLRNMRVLRDMGVRLALDDFGTGFSSLSYLKRFPLDTLKIDRSFVKDITEDDDSAAIAAAILSMARALNLKTIAEGVETERQLEFLRDNDCDQFQGWLFSAALESDAFIELLKKQNGLTD